MSCSLRPIRGLADNNSSDNEKGREKAARYERLFRCLKMSDSPLLVIFGNQGRIRVVISLVSHKEMIYGNGTTL